MPFIKGQPKPLNSGRRQGVRNKKTISKTSDILLNEGLNPTQELIKLLPELNARDKIDVWKYLHSFTESKPKIIDATELQEDESFSEDVDPENILKILKTNE